MALNLSDSSKYIPQQNNFGAGNLTPEDVAPAQVGILKSMDLPSTPSELVKYSPYFLTAYAGSKLISDSAVNGACLNPLKKQFANVNLADSFNNSKISKLSTKLDDFLYPIAQQYSSQISATKSAIRRFTPNWIKNLVEKINIGVTPINKAALDQYKGMTSRAAEQAISTLKSVAPEQLNKLGLAEVLTKFAKKELSATDTIIKIAEKLKNTPAADIKALTTAAGKKLKVLEELNTARAFVGANLKTTTAKGLQRGIMAVSEAAGGGVIGNSVFGIIMNSIFLASTIKRTWNAPWGEKLSTFMEGALVDFCGGYLMALLGTRITYKLLGAKNADKTAKQLADIKELTNTINIKKLKHLKLSKLINALKKGGITSDIVEEVISHGIKADSTVEQALQILSQKKLNFVTDINSSIDNLVKLRKLQDRGFFKNLINRPLRWIGNILCTGLENIPTKVNDGKMLSSFKIGIHSITNKLKAFAGYPIRFLLVLMVVTPPLTKLCAKISHTVFGKPTKSIMDEREGKKEEPQKNAPNSKDSQFIDMNTFSEYTKATGMAKSARHLTNHSKNTQVPEGIPPKMLEHALKKQLKRIEADKDNISPATYVPSITPSHFTSPEAKAIAERRMHKADILNEYIKQELKNMSKN